VLNDLQPYVCTYQNCDLGDQFFHSRDEWHDHESKRHRVKWYCNTDHHSQYENRGDFINHMKKDHDVAFDGSRFVTVQDMFRQPSRRDEGTCNLCMQESKKLKSHVSWHLEQMALFVLPMVSEPAESSGAEHCIVSYKYAAKDASDEQDDDEDQSQSSDVFSENNSDYSEQLQDSKPLNRQDDGPVTFSLDGKLTTGDTEDRNWNDVTSKFSDAQDGKIAEPPLMPSDGGFTPAEGVLCQVLSLPSAQLMVYRQESKARALLEDNVHQKP
jgi:hypothetical protein